MDNNLNTNDIECEDGLSYAKYILSNSSSIEEIIKKIDNENIIDKNTN